MAASTETHDGIVIKAWLHTLEDGGDITCFTLDGAPGIFRGGTDWRADSIQWL